MKETTNYYLSRAEILRRAWNLQRQTVEKYPDADRRATFSLCLRQAWEDARQPQTLEQFYALPGEEQLQILRKFAARCPAYAARAVKITEDPETGEKIKTPAPAAWAQWMQPRSAGGLELEPWAVAVDTVAAEAYIGLDRQPDDLPLGIILARAVKAACMRLSRVYRDAPNNRHKSKTQDGSGAILDPVSLDDPDYTGAAHFPGPEAAAIVRESVRTAAKDDTDLLILDLRAQGYTLQDCARAAGMSHPAILKRLRKMQQRLQDGGTVDAWLSGDDLKRPEQQPRPRTWTTDNASTGSSAGSSAAAAALYKHSTPAPQGRPQAAQERPQVETMTRSTGSSSAAQEAQEAAQTAAEAARREAIATRSLAKLAARQAAQQARSR